MTPLFSFATILNLLWISIAFIFAFFLPGIALLQPVNISLSGRYLLAPYIGLVMWGVFGFIFSSLGARWLLYPYIILLSFKGFLYLIQANAIKLSFKLTKHRIIVSGIIILGLLSQVFVVFFMGAIINGNMTMCCGHVPDNTLFLAITSEIVSNFPPQDPGLSGVKIVNYHFLGHLVVGNFIWAFNLPLILTTYQFFPFVLSLSLGVLTVCFSKFLKIKKIFTYWLLFFFYFGADAIFLLLLLMQKQSIFYFAAMESGTKFLFNYPRAFSIMGLLTGLILLLLWLQQRKMWLAFLCISVMASLIGYKAYTGVFVWSGMAGLVLWGLAKRDVKTIVIAILTVLISRFVFAPSGTGESGLFWSGMWRVHDFFAMRELGLSHWLLAREIYINHYNFLRVLLLDGWMMFIFITVTFGTKLLGIFQTRQSMSHFPSAVHAFLLLSLLSNTFVGLFFLQKPGGSISVNFLITVLIIFSFYTALHLTYCWSYLSKKLYIILSILIIAFTIPRTIYIVYESTTLLNKENISNEYLSFYEKVKSKTNKNDVIFPIGFPVHYGFLYQRYLTDRSQYLITSMYDDELRSLQQSREEELQILMTSSDQNILKDIFKKGKFTHLIYYHGANFPSKNDNVLYESLIVDECCSLLKIR